MIHQPVSVALQCSLKGWLKGQASEDQRRLKRGGDALKACSWWCATQIDCLLYNFTIMLLQAGVSLQLSCFLHFGPAFSAQCARLTMHYEIKTSNLVDKHAVTTLNNHNLVHKFSSIDQWFTRTEWLCHGNLSLHLYSKHTRYYPDNPSLNTLAITLTTQASWVS